MTTRTKRKAIVATQPEDSYEELARRLSAAAVSYLTGTTYQTAEKTLRGRPVGNFWRLLAIMVFDKVSPTSNVQ